MATGTAVLSKCLPAFNMNFPDLVEIRFPRARGILWWRQILVERYVDGKLVGSSWVGVGDTVHITININGWTE